MSKFTSSQHNGSFMKGGQLGWFHDEGDPSGFFHTYDSFKVEGSPHGERKIHVFLPRDYEFNNHTYPMVYFNDGNTTFFSGGVGNSSWNVSRTLTELYKKQEIVEVIVVAIYPVNRDYEYTSLCSNRGNPPGLIEYTDFITNDLKGFIDTHYRTSCEVRQNMIIGSSNGGLAAFFTGCYKPDAFGFVSALSPSFWAGVDLSENFPYIVKTDEKLKDSKLIEFVSDSLSKKKERPSIYLDWGLVREGGLHNSSIEERAAARGREMSEILQKDYGYTLGSDLFVYEDKTGDHTEYSWSKRLPAILKIFSNGRYKYENLVDI